MAPRSDGTAIISVTSCAECPFYDDDENRCRRSDRIFDANEHWMLRTPPPEWCPLKEQSVYIEISEKVS